jgi:hypothetical protein
MSVDKATRAIPSFDEMARRTKLNESYQKKWVHLDEEKPH